MNLEIRTENQEEISEDYSEDSRWFGLRSEENRKRSEEIWDLKREKEIRREN